MFILVKDVAIKMNFNFCLLVVAFMLNLVAINGLKYHQNKKLRKPKSRSDIPIDEEDYNSFEEELNHDLDRFKNIQKKIYQIRKLLKFKNQVSFSTFINVKDIKNQAGFS